MVPRCRLTSWAKRVSSYLGTSKPTLKVRISLSAQFGHGRGDRAGIEPAGEKDPQGHIRHQLEAHRLLEALAQFLAPILQASSRGRRSPSGANIFGS